MTLHKPAPQRKTFCGQVGSACAAAAGGCTLWPPFPLQLSTVSHVDVSKHFL